MKVATKGTMLQLEARGAYAANRNLASATVSRVVRLNSSTRALSVEKDLYVEVFVKSILMMWMKKNRKLTMLSLVYVVEQ